MNLLDYLPGVPDFPKPGILFRDISPLLANPKAFQYAVQAMSDVAKAFEFTHILGIESRGFIFGTALALSDSTPLILARKPNKLPTETLKESYGLEYGSDSLEIQLSIIPKNSRVLLVDDVLASGGTFIAASKLIQKAGSSVAGALALLELEDLGGAEKLHQQGIGFKSVLSI